MKRSELEHLIRAAGSIADDSEIVIIGSRSILGQFPARHGMTSRKVLRERLAETDLPKALGKLVSARIDRDFDANAPARGSRKKGSGVKS